MKKSLIYSKSFFFPQVEIWQNFTTKKIIEPMLVWHELFEHTTSLVLVLGSCKTSVVLGIG
jgi:hypothetical protein